MEPNNKLIDEPLEPLVVMSVKRRKHLERQAKKNKNVYTLQERQIEINKCKKQLNDMGLSQHYNEDTHDIHKMLDDYVKDGHSCSGHKAIEGTKRVFWYLLPKDKKHEISTCLKYDDRI
jgi:hypothetical protein